MQLLSRRTGIMIVKQRRMSASMVSYTLDVPYFCLFQKHLDPDQLIVIQGNLIYKKFEVNLCTERSRSGAKRGDKALHIDCKIGSRSSEVVVNAYQNGEALAEQKHNFHHKKYDDNFELKIRTHDDHYQMFVNSQSIPSYSHKLPLNDVKSLYIDGEIELTKVSWEGRSYVTPFTTEIQNWSHGRKLHLSGALRPSAIKFSINFHTDTAIAFHFNPRLKENKICLNSLRDGSWEEEMFINKCPFAAGRSFDVFISCTDSFFVVHLGDRHLCDFEYRFETDTINRLRIDGDIDIFSVHW